MSKQPTTYELAAAEQRILDLEAELAHARPVADAAHAMHAAEKALDEGDGFYRDVKRARAAFVAACEATTPSATPPTHVIVAVDELERLRAVDGHRAVLAERCARKDLELDELRERGGV